MEVGLVILSRVVKVIFEKRPERHERVRHADVWEKSIPSSKKALGQEHSRHGSSREAS